MNCGGDACWTDIRSIVSTYLPALYIPEAGEEVNQPAVRALPPADGIAAYTAPNYVTGIAGAFLSLVRMTTLADDVSDTLTSRLLTRHRSSMCLSASSLCLSAASREQRCQLCRSRSCGQCGLRLTMSPSSRLAWASGRLRRGRRTRAACTCRRCAEGRDARYSSTAEQQSHVNI